MRLSQYLFTQFDRLRMQRCILCDASATPKRALCHACYEALPFNQYACRRCAMPLPISTSTHTCGACLKASPIQQTTIAAFHYQSPLDAWIQALKFSGKLYYARLLGTLLAEQLQQRQVAKPEVILPVPLHPSRQRNRGFNQAIEIARVVSRTLDIPLNLEDCHRLRATEHQSRLPAKHRKRNVARAFSFETDACYRSVAIVDDVITTGHTIHEAVHCIHQAGIEHIQVWCVARATHSHRLNIGR